jgi:ABC-2 type transport system ATP-binding protein
MNHLIRVSRLERSFGDVHAVRGVDFTVGRGEVLGFLGPNGAGKSTTMKMLVGTLAPSAGAVEIDGIDLFENPLKAKAKLGYLPEQPPLYKEHSVDEFLAFCARIRQVATRDVPQAVIEAKDRCGLADTGRRLIANLSKGYQQRVGIAQAIIHRPSIVVLDEPTTGLDPIQIREIRALIRELGDAHCVILSTHILAEVQSVCDRAIILNEGRIVFDSPLSNLGEMAGQAHRLTLRDAPPAELLESIAGIERVGYEGVTILCVNHDGKLDTLDAVVDAATPYGIRDLRQVGTTLEEIFIGLTIGPASPRDAMTDGADATGPLGSPCSR